MSRQKRQQRHLYQAQMAAYGAQATQAAQQAQLAAAHAQAVQNQQWMATVDHLRARAAEAPIKCQSCGKINARRSTSCASCAAELAPNQPMLPPHPSYASAMTQPSIAAKLWRWFRGLPTWVQVMAWLIFISIFLSGLVAGHTPPATTTPAPATTTVMTPTPTLPDSFAPQSGSTYVP